jgi:hypothetical protein
MSCNILKSQLLVEYDLIPEKKEEEKQRKKKTPCYWLYCHLRKRRKRKNVTPLLSFK